MAGSSSDSDLLRQATSGDDHALAELLQEHGPVVRRRLAGEVSRRWQSALSMDDVMQQTYADAFLDIGRFDPDGEGSFVAWLTSLAKCNLVDVLRMLEAEKRGKGRGRVQPEAGHESFVALSELLDAGRSTPSRHVARDEACAALECAIQQLPESYRRVVQMFDIEERPMKEVAQALNRSLGAVYMVRARAHRRLREFMGSASNYFSKA